MPLLATSITAACTQHSAHSDQGDHWVLLAFLGIVGILTVEHLISRFSVDWLIWLTGLLLVALALTVSVVGERVLQERGVAATCTVVSIKKETSHAYGAPGSGASSTTYYYRLACPGGYPIEMSFRDRHGDEGDPLRVTYDPDHRVNPILTSDARDRRDLWLAGLLLAASVVLRLCYALRGKTTDP
ncbi:MAG TPA: hypothetical protein VFM55_10915 [Micromonosporaceae bacterium]|nr:hypothetical protein [Micromonosporaceae bacterium]